MKIRPGDESVDSGSESQPLLSSDNSQTSLVATHCIFPDSETSDFDQTLSRNAADSLKKTNPLYGGTNITRPSYYLDQMQKKNKSKFPKRKISNGISKSTQYEPSSLNNFQYYSKLRSSLPICETPMEKEIINVSCRTSYSENPSSTQSSLVTIFSIWNTIIGSSLLTMSWCIEKSGLIPGLILILIISGICLFTAYTILNVSRDHGMTATASEVPELCRLLLGSWAEHLAKLFSIIVLLGATAVYWVLMSNFFYHSINVIHDLIIGSNHTVVNRTVICPRYENVTLPNVSVLQESTMTGFEKMWDLYSTVPVFLALIMFPLLNFKSATFFTKFNSFGTVSVVYLFIFVGIKAFGWGINMPKNWFEIEIHLKPNFTVLTGVLCLSYFIHNIIISLMKSNHHQSNNGRDLTIAYLLCTVTYIFIGVVFYVTFPLDKSCIEDNILNNFVKWDLATILARLLLMFQLVTVFPLITFMLRQNVLALLVSPIVQYSTRTNVFPFKCVVVFNMIVILIGILIACLLPRIGTIIRYTGAIAGFIWIFTLPSLLKISSLRKQQKLTPIKVIFLTLIIVIGLLNLVAQFFVVE